MHSIIRYSNSYIKVDRYLTNLFDRQIPRFRVNDLIYTFYLIFKFEKVELLSSLYLN
jgi:hypothetical protein